MCRLDLVRRGTAFVQVLDSYNVHVYTITFLTCSYIKCPSTWKGANFRIGTEKEHVLFLESVPTEIKDQWRVKNLKPEVHYYDYQTLYIADIDQTTDKRTQVIFVANNMQIERR